MMMRSDRKPPLARSPVRLRSRLPLKPATNSFHHTPPGSASKKRLRNQGSAAEESELRPEYQAMSCELVALEKMVREEFGNGDAAMSGFASAFCGGRSPMFERGRLYDEYSARRNERLKRKKCGGAGEQEERRSAAYDLGVKVESEKRGESKKVERSVKKTALSTPTVAEQREGSRYFLRSAARKENAKPVPLAMSYDRSACGTARKAGAWKTRKI